MSKRTLTYLIVGLTLFNCFLGFQFNLLRANPATTPIDKNDSYANIRLFTRVLETIRNSYVDGEKVSYQDLIYAALKGMLGSLDPHSQFMEPSNYEDMKDTTQGEFGGLGIVVSVKDNTVVVVSPMEDTPGFRAGLMPGDRIVKIDGKTAETMQLSDVVKKLRGKPGTDVQLTVFRPKSKEIKEYKLTRDIIKVDSVKDINGKREFPLLADKIGYVRITQFNEPTSEEFEKALSKMEQQGVKGMVIDLRGNPGGLLDTAIDICSNFVPEGSLVVSTEGRDPANKQIYRSRPGNKHNGYPVAILISGGSASASEIVAGCLQDLKRAIIVGETSFGKGSVQSVLPNEDGSAIRLTTAKYYTPSHKVIHEKGVSPDIVVPMTEDEEEKLYISRMPAYEEDGTLKKREPFVDPQLNRALDVIKGIRIYAERTGQAPAYSSSAPAPAPAR